MKRTLLLFMAALLFAAASVSAPARAASELDQILANMQKTAGGIRTLYAMMEQQKRLDIGGVERYVGHIFFSQAGKGTEKVRIEYDVPKGQVLWVLGDNVTLYQPSINQAIRTTRRAQASRSADVSFIASPYQSVPQLKSQYNISYLGEDSGRAKLELTPRGRSAVRQVILWVDRSNWMPVKYQVTEANGNLSVFTLTNVQVNGRIPSKKFEVKLPSGVKEVRQ